MKPLGVGLLTAFLLLVSVDATPASGNPEPRFVAYDVRIDPGNVPLAAWQIEVTYDPSTTKILSLEGGETAAYRDAPHYDPRGFTAGRIVIAAFSTTDEAAPRGSTRVARLHLRIVGNAAAPAARLVTAARPGGQKIEARVTLALASSDEGGK